jgi:hypothetical protein
MPEEESPAEHYRKRAAKARDIAKKKSRENPLLSLHLVRLALEYDEIAEGLEAEPASRKPKR